MIKKTGIIRTIDELGRVVIPIELRNGLGWNEKESLEIYIESNKICIRQPKFEGRIDSVGIIRKLDELGRIVIPKEIRNKFDIAFKDAVEILVDNDVIMIMKKELTCVFCNNNNQLKEFNEKLVCSRCLKKLKSI